MKIALVAVNAKYIHSSLALRYLKNACENEDVRIYEFTINDRVANVVARLFETGCDLFAFSCYIWNREFVLKVCALLKQVRDCTILLGGPEVSYDTAELMAQHTDIDYVIAGEGEQTLQAFIREEKPEHIDGLCWRRGGEIIVNPSRLPVLALDDIPSPYDKAEIERLKGKIIYYETCRGCPYGCSYCLSSTLKGVRYFSMERVKKDLLLFMKNRVPLVKLVDRTFNADSKRSAEILRFILDHNHSTCFHFEVAADVLTDEFMALLECAPDGYFQIEAGVQSVHPQTLSAVNRRMDLERLAQNIARLRKNAKVHIHLDLIAGLPYEELGLFQQSFDWVFALRPHALQLGFLKLLRGTPIRETAAAHGYKFDPAPPYEVLANRYLSYGALLHLKDVEDGVEKYYNSGVFEKSCLYGAAQFATPFDFFSGLAGYLRRMNPQGRAIGRQELYDLLYDFFTSAKGADPVFCELLKFDFILHNQGVRLPNWAECRGDKAFYRQWSGWLMQEENRNTYGIDSHIKATEVANNYRFERFCCDAAGDLSMGETVMLFDYRRKCAKKVSEKA